MNSEKKYGVALVGYGYWGPNLARNFSKSNRFNLVSVWDLNSERINAARLSFPEINVVSSLNDVLHSPSIDMVAIATPVSTHYEIAKEALLNKKHVMLEKPMTSKVSEARELCEIASNLGLMLAVDHTYLYTNAVQRIKEIIDSGELGEILYIDSTRLNLGLFQHDVNVVWDLAPHDISIVAYLLGAFPDTVRAMGRSHTASKLEDVCYLHLEYYKGPIVHVHLNWIAPAKVRQMIIGGTKKMLVFDDNQASEKIRLYDKGINFQELGADDLNNIKIQYRTGDIVIPQIASNEALADEIQHFAQCLDKSVSPQSDGSFGMSVCRVLEAADESLANKSSLIRIENHA